MLGVEVDSPHPVGFPIGLQPADVDRQVVEGISSRGLPRLMNETDTHAAVGVDTPTILMEGIAEGGGELHQQKRQVVLASCQMPRTGSRSVLDYYIIGEGVKGQSLVALPCGVEGSIRPVEVGMVRHSPLLVRVWHHDKGESHERR